LLASANIPRLTDIFLLSKRDIETEPEEERRGEVERWREVERGGERWREVERGGERWRGGERRTIVPCDFERTRRGR
jgi:hypothetical protein